MLADLLARYLEIYPEENVGLKLLLKQTAAGEVLNDRRNFNGHIAGSAIILSPDRRQILFIHHKLFDVWQQPGGHWEENEANPLEASKREAIEETGAHLETYLPVDDKHPLVPLDIDTHEVPARSLKNEPAHYHHDFRYVFVAADTQFKHQPLEVYAAKWFDLSAPETNRIRRTVKKLKVFM